MNKRITSITIGLALLGTVAWAADYSVTDIGTLGGTVTVASALNDAGRVVGRSDVTANDTYHAVAFDGLLLDLGGLQDYPETHAFAINNSGQVLGVGMAVGTVYPRAILWYEGGITELGDFLARDINEGGLVVGTTQVQAAGLTAVPRASRYDGTLTTLGTLGGEYSEALAVNDSGWIVGAAALPTVGVTHGFVYLNSVMYDLGTLGGTFSFAYDINNAGQIVGGSKTSAGVMHAFLFTVDDSGTVISKTDLGELAGAYSMAYALNEGGLVVGTSDDRAFIWESGVMTDLNTRIPADAGWKLSRALAINESGQIAGEGWHAGQARGFLLTPSTPCAGDANGDGTVDPLDSGYVMARFGCAVGTGNAECDAADVNGDNQVDPLDAGFVLARLGTCN